MADKKCKNCDKTLTGRWKNFCCIKCGTLYYIKNHHLETDIEKKVRLWLISKDIKFEEQISISNITVPDFIINKTAIFCDGDYFHSLPRRAYRDNRINKRLEAKGYKVLRYKGSDILNNFDKVTTNITNYIK